jgi:PIN domain nuclease of toxin-antitoxin system
MIVLDTHAWIWWLSNPEHLSAVAKEKIEEGVKNRSVHVSCISTWETALLVAKGRLQLTMDVRDWIAKTESLPFVMFIPVSNGIAVKSVFLPEPLHKDPADRIIVATALALGDELITKDEKLQEYPHVKTVW